MILVIIGEGRTVKVQRVGGDEPSQPGFFLFIFYWIKLDGVRIMFKQWWYVTGLHINRDIIV